MLLLNFTVPADLLCIFYILLGLFFCRDIFYFAYSNVFRAEALFIQLALNIVEFECLDVLVIMLIMLRIYLS